MEPSTTVDPDGVAAAKARLHTLIGAIDPLKPMRQRPVLTIAIAGMAGAMLAVNTEKLIGAATFTKAITSLVHMVTTAIHKHQEYQEAVPQGSPN